MPSYTKNSLQSDGIDASEAEKLALDLLEKSGATYLVYAFDNAPEILKNLCSYNGGDEDWMVIGYNGGYQYSWIEAMDSCHEPDQYMLDNITIWIGSHA